MAELNRRVDALNEEFRTRMEEVQAITNRTERQAKMRELGIEIRQRRSAIRLEILKSFALTEERVEDLESCPSEIRMQSLNAEQKKISDDIAKANTPTALRSIDLGALGSSITMGWHGGLHGRYTDMNSPDCENGDNSPRCDHMGSASQSHVNQHFYKVHGLVDSHIDKWLAANGYETAARDCTGKTKCYKLGDLWMGDVPDYIRGTGCSYGTAPATDSTVPATSGALK